MGRYDFLVLSFCFIGLLNQATSNILVCPAEGCHLSAADVEKYFPTLKEELSTWNFNGINIKSLYGRFEYTANFDYHASDGTTVVNCTAQWAGGLKITFSNMDVKCRK